MTSVTTGFYQESKHGWFWYEDPAPVVEEEQKVAVDDGKSSHLTKRHPRN